MSIATLKPEPTTLEVFVVVIHTSVTIHLSYEKALDHAAAVARNRVGVLSTSLNYPEKLRTLATDYFKQVEFIDAYNDAAGANEIYIRQSTLVI